MAWDMNKCVNNVPDPFTDTDALAVVNSADFSSAVYVNISAQNSNTKQAYTYVDHGGIRLCVVGHVHKDRNRRWTVPGNSFIPGWQNWAVQTPGAAVTAIAMVATGGTFPGDDRYPQ